MLDSLPHTGGCETFLRAPRPGDRACSSDTVLIEKAFPRVEKAFVNVHPGIARFVLATARVHLARF